MPTNRDAVREIINKAWESGRAKGLTDEEIIDIIEDTLRQREEERGRVVVTATTPQVLYGPPPMKEVRVTPVEVHEIKMPQVLYGPPPKAELHEMFLDPQEGEKKTSPQDGNRRRI